MMAEFSYNKVRERFYPTIPVIVSNNKNQIKLFALVDSGGVLSLFTIDTARQLGLVVKAGQFQEIEGVSGRISVYVHTLRLIVAEKEFSCRVGFSEDYKASFNILARSDFFEQFKITFDEGNKRLYVE